MDTTLTGLLFVSDKLINNNGISHYILPNLQDGFDLRTSSGEILASSKADVAGQGEIWVNASGERIAQVRENVYDGTTIDFTGGDVLTGYPNIYSGENYYNFGESIAYTAPGFDGGMDLISTTGSSILSIVPNALGEVTINTPITVDIPFMFQDPISVSSHLGEISDITQLAEYGDAVDFVDTASGLSDVLGLF